MIISPPFPEKIVDESPLASHSQFLKSAFERGWQQLVHHGDFPRWQRALANLPVLEAVTVSLNQHAITVEGSLSKATSQQLRDALKALMPWRKGPFHIADIEVECEWRSDLKWDRLADAVSSLEGRTVLDVGCGSGYHCWRMRGSGAKLIIGIDPTALFAMQFQSIQHFIIDTQVQMWPLGIDDMPDGMHCFDTIFSMGLLYHRRSPLDHLKQLQTLLRPEGELVLETLVIDGDDQTCLMPKNRYAKMRNIWFIPSVAMLTIWLKRGGWRNIRLIDCTTTTSGEQRSTEWMQSESLADFLDPSDASRTIEGYPSPQRATLIAQR